MIYIYIYIYISYRVTCYCITLIDVSYVIVGRLSEAENRYSGTLKLNTLLTLVGLHRCCACSR